MNKKKKHVILIVATMATMATMATIASFSAANGAALASAEMVAMMGEESPLDPTSSSSCACEDEETSYIIFVDDECWDCLDPPDCDGPSLDPCGVHLLACYACCGLDTVCKSRCLETYNNCGNCCG